MKIVDTDALQEAELTPAEIFEGDEFSEQGKQRIVALFNAAVDVRASTIVSELDKPINVVDALEFKDDDLTDRSKEEFQRLFIKAVICKIAKHLEDACVEQFDEEAKELHRDYASWLNENREEILQRLQIEKTEALTGFLLDCFLENYAYVPANRTNVATELMEQNKALSEQVAQSSAATVAMNEASENLERAEILEQFRASKNMTLMDKGRLAALAEGMTIDTLRNNLERMYETHFQKRPVGRADVLSEVYEPEPATKYNRHASPLAIEAARLL
jgi:hypothetical protein